MKRSLLVVFVFFYSSLASADNYYWYYSYNASVRFSSAVDACKYAVGTNPAFQYSSANILSSGSSVYAECYANLGSSGPMLYTTVQRLGDGCAPDHTYNSQTGECTIPSQPDGIVCTDDSVPPPRVYQSGVCVNLGSATKETKCKYYATGGTANTTPRVYWLYEGKGDFSQQLTGKDASGCETKVENPDLQKDCKYTPEMKYPAQPGAGEGGSDLPGYTQPGTYKCKFSATLTGNVSPEGGSAEPTDKICTEPGSPRCALQELPKEVETKPCTYTTAADGSQVCASSTKESKPGSTSCGYVGSTWTCKDDLPNAVGKGLTIATKVTTETTSDGKSKITKTDTLYDTTCKGTPAACSTKSSVSTTTTVKNGSGQTESVSGSCTGPHCADSNTNPDGDGDGFGDCTGDDCSDGEGGAGVKHPELGDVPGFGEALTTFESSVANSPIPSTLKGFRAPTGGQCPQGTAEVFFGELEFSAHCQLIEEQEPLIKLISKLVWAFMALMVFLG
ncbi:hypothetical protein LJR232_003134 [Aquipseudomonas alcaligenes]